MGDAVALAVVSIPREWTDRKEAVRRVHHYSRIPRSDASTARGLLDQMIVHGLVEVRAKHLGVLGEEVRLAEQVQQQVPVEKPKDRNVYDEITDENGRVNKFVHGTPEAAAEHARVRAVWQAQRRRELGLD